MSDWEMNYEKAADHWVLRDIEAVHMKKADLKEKIEGFIGAHNTCALATGCDGFVRCTPIEYKSKSHNIMYFWPHMITISCMRPFFMLSCF